MLIHKFSPFNSWNDFSVPFRLVEDSLNRAAEGANPVAKPWLPAVDILEDESQLVITADLPGIDLAKIDIRLENGTLIVKEKDGQADESVAAEADALAKAARDALAIASARASR